MTRNVLSAAMKDILDDLPDFFRNLPSALWDVITTVVLPLAITLGAIGGFLRLVSIINKWVFPPNAEELHKLALGQLKKGDNEASREEAKRLLRKSLKLNPNLLQNHLTLAAIEIYQEEDAKAGGQTVRTALKLFPDNKDLKQMELDCRAVAQNMGHMINAGFSSSKYLGDYMYRPLK